MSSAAVPSVSSIPGPIDESTSADDSKPVSINSDTPGPPSGITGSTGKTLTKDFTAAVLGLAGHTIASKGSFNNEIGVPLTVLEVRKDTEFMVLEMGSRGKGHLEELCAYARPEVGVVTNIGWTHMQFFRTRDNLARAKAELLVSLPRSGWAVINGDDDYAEMLRASSPCPVITFGRSRAADVWAEDERVDKNGKVVFTLKSKGGCVRRIAVPLPGRHNVDNVLAAAAVGKIMGVDMETIAEGIEVAETSGWRMEMIDKPDEITIINDAYNANPVSMRSALMALGDISREKRAIAVLALISSSRWGGSRARRPRLHATRACRGAAFSLRTGLTRRRRSCGLSSNRET